jgi:Undecaprenyl-phosphate galactose phosphotransferase WbaP
MATVMTAPERAMPGTNHTLESQHSTHPFGARQIICALVLMFMDTAMIMASVFTALMLRIHVVPHFHQDILPVFFSLKEYLVFCSIWLVLIIFIGVEGLYTQRRTLWNEVGHVTKAVGLGIVAILAALSLTKLSPALSRATILLTAVNLVLMLPVVRCWAKWILTSLGPWRKRILILGAAETARLAVQGLVSDAVLGYEVVGLLDDGTARRGECFGTCSGTPIPVLGNLSQAREIMECTQARDVLIAMPDLSEEQLLAIVHKLQPACDSVYVVPHLWGLPMMNLHVDGFLRERVMMLKLSNNLAKPWNRWLKRLLDLVLGSLLAIVTLPAAVIIAALIKLDSEGPSLFVQDRIGYQGETFRCIKFRTMRACGKDHLAEYLEQNPLAAEEWRTYAKLRNYDPRVTRIGRFLRRWSLDEIPQLINVLRGDMSLIGPRPYLPEEGPRIGINLATILSARPGVTGFWQVNGRNQLTLEERVQLESWYVRNWTVWLDCIVLAKTFRAVLFPSNSHPSKMWEVQM